MNNSFDFFDKIYCIHLPERKDRLVKMSKEFEKINVTEKVEYMSAEKPHKELQMSNLQRGPAGELGCSLSHIKAIINGLNNGCENILIVEDDTKFLKNCNENLEKSLQSLPVDWGVFYLTAIPRLWPTKVSDNLMKIERVDLASAYAISKKNLMPFFNFWLDNIGKPHPSAAYDIILSNFLSDNSYCAYPVICAQQNDQSNITGRLENVERYSKWAWDKFLKPKPQGKQK